MQMTENAGPPHTLVPGSDVQPVRRPVGHLVPGLLRARRHDRRAPRAQGRLAAGPLPRRRSRPTWPGSTWPTTSASRPAGRTSPYIRPPLPKDLTLAGPIQAELWVCTSGTLIAEAP